MYNICFANFRGGGGRTPRTPPSKSATDQSKVLPHLKRSRWSWLICRHSHHSFNYYYISERCCKSHASLSVNVHNTSSIIFRATECELYWKKKKRRRRKMYKTSIISVHNKLLHTYNRIVNRRREDHISSPAFVIKGCV